MQFITLPLLNCVKKRDNLHLFDLKYYIYHRGDISIREGSTRNIHFLSYVSVMVSEPQ